MRTICVIAAIVALCVILSGCGALQRVETAVVGPQPPKAEVESFMDRLGLEAEDYGLIIVSQAFQDRTGSGAMDKLTDTAGIVGPLVAAPNALGATVSVVGLLTDSRHDVKRLERRDTVGQTVTLVRKDKLQSLAVGMQGYGRYPHANGDKPTQDGGWNDNIYATFEQGASDIVLKLIMAGLVEIDAELKAQIEAVMAEAIKNQPPAGDPVIVENPNDEEVPGTGGEFDGGVPE
jgi:hypothetical protein